MIKHRIVYNTAVEWKFDIEKALGSYLWDTSGNTYIDFSSGWNTTNLGWNNPEINEFLQKQLSIRTYAPMWAADEMQICYAEALTNSLPSCLDTVCRATGGTEANEMALKIARAATGRKKFVSFKHTYHGQSFGTIALGYVPEYVKQIAPLVPEYIQLDFPSVTDETKVNEKEILATFLESIEKILKTNEVAAVLTEAGMITGWGSMLVAPQGYLQGLSELTRQYGTLLILDEVGTGFSRTGKLYALEHENVVPDMVTFAKGVANGAVPLGAVAVHGELVKDHIAEFKPTSSYGWTPLACAAALKTLEIHLRDQVWEQVGQKGNFVMQYLASSEKLKNYVKNIRGKGLEIGFDLKNAEYKKVLQKSWENGLHIADAGDCIQLMPPLTIDQSDLVKGLEILEAAIIAK